MWAKRLTLFGLVSMTVPAAALAQTPQVPPLEGVAVNARAVVDPDSDVIRYELMFHHRGTQLPVITVELDTSSDASRLELDANGLSFAEPHSAATTSLAHSALGAGRYVAIGALQAPQFWTSAVGLDARLRFGQLLETANLMPGGSAGPFIVTSRGLPGIRASLARANLDAFLPDADAPGVDLDGLEAALERGNQPLFTIGPTAPPVAYDRVSFLAEIAAYRARAEQLGWIRSAPVVDEIDALLEQLRAALVSGDLGAASGTADDLIELVEANSCEELVCPDTTPLTSEARALLAVNLAYLADDLPEPPPDPEPVLATAELWLGLRSSEEAGAFDVRVEVRKNNQLMAAGESRCISGLARNPSAAREVDVPFASVPDVDVNPGDVVTVRALARIGTKTDGSRCAARSTSAGLRLYYDSVQRPSGLRADLGAGAKDYFLHTYRDRSGFDDLAPKSPTADTKDSSSLTFSRGNAWREIGAWSRPLTPRDCKPYHKYKRGRWHYMHARHRGWRR